MTSSAQDKCDLAAKPSMQVSMRQKVVYSLRIRRPEYLVAAIPIAVIPAVVSSGDVTALLSLKFLVAFFIVQLIINYGDMINCYGDRDQDAVYKHHLSDAVNGLGLRCVRRQISLTALTILAFGAWLSILTSHWDIMILIAIELVWAAQYSVGPLRLKGAGTFQIPTLVMIIFVIPMLIVYRTFESQADTLAALALISGYGVALEGVIIVNTAEDYPEDLSFGVRTSVIALGINRALRIATVMAASGSTAVVYGLHRSGSGFGVVLTAVAAAAVVFILVRLSVVQARRGQSDVEVIRKYAQYVPHMLAALAWTTTIAAVAGAI